MTASRYAAKLGRASWLSTCESFNVHTSLRRMWTVCNAMMGERKDCNMTPNLALGANKSVQEVIQAVRDVFFPQPVKRTDNRLYEPGQSVEADYKTDITAWELEAGIERGNERRAAGLDRINNAMLKNLNDGSKKKLLEQINRIWRTGRIPDE